MSPCSSSSDCFKASLQFKIEKSLGKTTPGETLLQYLNTGSTPSSGTPPVKSTTLGQTFDAQG